MTLFEHYKVHSLKSIKPYTRLLILATLVITAIYTYALYSNDSNANAGMQIAKWNIKVNDELVTSDNNSFVSSIKIISNNNLDTSVGAGETGYFDITIDPQTTEVSLEYTIKINTSSLPSGTIVTGCELYNSSNVKVEDVSLREESGKKCIDDSILLDGHALDSTDKKIYRVYCKLDDDVIITNEQLNSFYANVEIDGRQIIN